MTAKDKIEELRGGLIQHGPGNDRVYLMRLAPDAAADFPEQLVALAEENGYAKIFAKVPEAAAAGFFEAGFCEEARIPGFFAGRERALFLCRYLQEARSRERDAAAMDKIMRLAREKQVGGLPPLDARFTVRRCEEADAAAMAAIYRQVFPSYPFPISEPEYLIETMRSHVAYFGIATAGRLIALGSAETDSEAANAEITDFATLPEWAGSNLALHLLRRMELHLRQEGILTAYTIARAMSPGMNITFAKAAYQFAGRLKNNTNISGGIESMNVWHKPLT
ncbi:putative beta-lysine N-acetyltransferase [Candidatus Electronema sp. JC]|uniref:putative beta-lysine N-acetyltransferase n=1 Tax=Candidatus Electronema sp. JC TaxID=3401570 RepID=UPI003AA882E7